LAELAAGRRERIGGRIEEELLLVGRGAEAAAAREVGRRRERVGGRIEDELLLADGAIISFSSSGPSYRTHQSPNGSFYLRKKLCLVY